MKKTIDYCTSEKIELIAFLNKDAHEESIKSSFEGLFNTIGRESGEKIERVK